jgi:GTP cyclohydrolase I
MISTEIKRFYDPTFTVSADYKASLPDLQNGPASLIEGANVPIQQVGISNFKLPLSYKLKDGSTKNLETSVDGYVSLDAGKKGINMSRIMRVFYEFQHDTFDAETLRKILVAYKDKLDSKESYLKLNFSLPLLMDSLRSDMQGYQYYNVALEGHLNEKDVFSHLLHVEFVYSSACPCSYELAEHARETRGVAAIPHSQRSVANVSVRLRHPLFAEDLIGLCREALKTETQVMVKREDEQAFAELNGAYQKFVEDAARLLFEQLDGQEAIADFVVRCAHLESLHSHDAVSRICKGVPGGMR